MLQLGQRLPLTAGLAVGPFRGHRREGDADADDPGADRDVLAGEALRVAAAVEALRHGGDRRRDAGEPGRRRDDLGAGHGVVADQLDLGRVERTLLFQHRFGHRQQPDVLQLRGEEDVVDGRFVEAEPTGDRDRAEGDGAQVFAQVRTASAEHRHQYRVGLTTSRALMALFVGADALSGLLQGGLRIAEIGGEGSLAVGAADQALALQRNGAREQELAVDVTVGRSENGESLHVDAVDSATNRPDRIEEPAGDFGDEPVRHPFAKGVVVGLQAFELDDDQGLAPVRVCARGAQIGQQLLAVGQAGDLIAGRALLFDRPVPGSACGRPRPARRRRWR